MKGRQKLYHLCSTYYHNIFMNKELSLKKSEKIGLYFKLYFRALLRSDACEARDLRLNRFKLQSFVYLP